MDSINNCCNKINGQVKKMVMLSAVSVGLTFGIYASVKKIMEMVEDKRLARYYEDEIENIFKEKERMDFYEKEFIRQEEEEQKKQKEHEELEQAVEEFNSKRLRREECPLCSDHK